MRIERWRNDDDRDEWRKMGEKGVEEESERRMEG